VPEGTWRFYALQGRKQHISGSAASAGEFAYFKKQRRKACRECGG